MILCCGEALIDMLPRQSTEGGACFQPFSGGAVFNTSIALARLGAPVGFFTGLSNDLFGVQLTQSLTESGVDTSLVARSNLNTTLAFVTLTDGQARYAFYDENTAGRMLSLADIPDIPNDVDTLFFGGISLVVEPCGTTYEHMMLTAAKDRVTMIDPNVRPTFIKDPAAYRDRLSRLISAADIVKFSDEDLRWLFDGGESRDLAEKVLAMGPSFVCVTEGAKGAWGITADHEVFIDATRVTPVDTVGAGDTFNAGLLSALNDSGALTGGVLARLDEARITAAVSLATRAAAVTVSREGANPPYRHELV